MKTLTELRASLTDFERSYIETAFWSSNDESTPEGGEPFDQNYSIEDISAEALQRIIDDCQSFLKQHADLIDQALTETDLEHIAHDFWLTRNRHGAGFWDGDYPDDLGEQLTKAAHSFGECNLYVGDDKQIHIA